LKVYKKVNQHKSTSFIDRKTDATKTNLIIIYLIIKNIHHLCAEKIKKCLQEIIFIRDVAIVGNGL